MLAVNPLLYSGDSLTYEGSIPYASGTIPGRSMIISKYHACGGRGFPGQGAFGGGGGRTGLALTINTRTLPGRIHFRACFPWKSAPTEERPVEFDSHKIYVP